MFQLNYSLFIYDSFTSFSHNFQVPNLQDCKLFTMTWAENDGYMLVHAMTISLHVPGWPGANSHGNPERKLPSTKGFVEEYDFRRQWTRQLGFQWNIYIYEHLQWPIFGKWNSVITKVGPYFRWSRTGIPAASSCPWRSPQNVFQIPWLDLADQAICWWLDLSQRDLVAIRDDVNLTFDIQGIWCTSLFHKWPKKSQKKKLEAKEFSEYRSCSEVTRWWFQTFFIFTSIWGRFPFWLIFFNWVETTNQS